MKVESNFALTPNYVLVHEEENIVCDFCQQTENANTYIFFIYLKRRRIAKSSYKTYIGTYLHPAEGDMHKRVFVCLVNEAITYRFIHNNTRI